MTDRKRYVILIHTLLFNNQFQIRAQVKETQRRVEEERRKQEKAKQRLQEVEVILHTLMFPALYK